MIMDVLHERAADEIMEELGLPQVVEQTYECSVRGHVFRHFRVLCSAHHFLFKVEVHAYLSVQLQCRGLKLGLVSTQKRQGIGQIDEKLMLVLDLRSTEAARGIPLVCRHGICFRSRPAMLPESVEAEDANHAPRASMNGSVRIGKATHAAVPLGFVLRLPRDNIQ